MTKLTKKMMVNSLLESSAKGATRTPQKENISSIAKNANLITVLSADRTEPKPQLLQQSDYIDLRS